MRASELLGRGVVDASGRALGPVRDVRLSSGADGRLRVSGLVLGGGRLASMAHRWGYVEGRARGPWLFRALTAHAARRARFLPVERVSRWSDDGVVVMRGAADDLPPIGDGRTA